MSKPTYSYDLWKRYGNHTLRLVMWVLVARLIAMALIPLNDSTEARYGEIARLMVTEDNWVSLMHYPNEFFWAKPPLSTWLSAFSMKMFSANAFFARLPAMFLSILSLSLIATMAFSRWGKSAALWSVAILSTMLFFLLDAGTVMTDPSLLATVVIVMVGFWQALQTSSHSFWRYVPFVGWGLGLLAKGPVAGIFTLLPIATWLSLTQHWRICWQKLPWIKGSLITLIIAAPWYYLAETRTPGFLNYFILGEHISRFLKPGWTGDLYGFAHHAPRGMIWIYFIVGSLPWSFAFLTLTVNEKPIFKIDSSERDWVYYLASFVLMPLVFFSFARNIIYPYVFPVLPAFALIITHFMLKTSQAKNCYTFLKITAAILSGAFLFMSLMFIISPHKVSKSQNLLVAYWENLEKNNDEHLIFIREKPEYSAMFYSKGKALASENKNQVCKWLNEGPQYIVINGRNTSKLAKDIQQSYTPLKTIQHPKYHDGIYYIEEPPLFCETA